MMGLTRCYKTGGFFTFIVLIYHRETVGLKRVMMKRLRHRAMMMMMMIDNDDDVAAGDD